MKEVNTTEEKKPQNVSQATQQEDAALKVMMQFFADEMLPFLGIQGKAVSAAPTESIYLELKKLYEDFNLVMEDGSWKHFEFQSTDKGVNDLKRFRSYEAVASFTHGVEITTYVLYSGTIKHPVTEFTEGVNTYRVVPIIMKDKNADELIRNLKEKAARGGVISKADLIQMTLSPLMGGNISLKDRILAAYELTGKATEIEITSEEKRKIEAVIYTMADKFLDSISMKEAEDAIKMTKLGQMLVNDGFSQGIQKGTEQTKLDSARNLLDLLDEKTIAERIGLPLETVKQLKTENK